MEIGRLYEFIHLADTLSFAETSRAFFLSQSVLSKHIASMEDELGCKLFVRDSHHVRLTDAGRSFKEDAKKITARFDAALTRLNAINDAYKAIVTVGYLRNAARPFLSDFIIRMKKQFPQFRVALRCMEYEELKYAVSIDAVDIAFGMDTEPQMHACCDYMRIYDDRFDAIVGFSHPLASQESVDVSALADYRLLLPEPEAYGGMTSFIEGFLPVESLNAPRGQYRDVDTLFLKVETENYVGFSSEHNYPLFSDKVRFVAIDGVSTQYSVGAFVRKGKHTVEEEACLQVLEESRAALERRMAKRLAAGKFRF